jgi:hypothetical protein
MQSHKGILEELNKALSHKPMASETVLVTVLPPVSVWWTTTFLRFLFCRQNKSCVKIKIPLISPKIFKKIHFLTE